jgi:hypothetical protein
MTTGTYSKSSLLSATQSGWRATLLIFFAPCRRRSFCCPRVRRQVVTHLKTRAKIPRGTLKGSFHFAPLTCSKAPLLHRRTVVWLHRTLDN